MYPGSHLAITPQTLQGAPSYADIAKRLSTGANTPATSDPSRRRDRRLVNNPTTAVPATASTTRPRTSRDRDTSELDTAPKTRSRDGQVSPSFGVLVLVVLNSTLRCSLMLLQTRL